MWVLNVSLKVEVGNRMTIEALDSRIKQNIFEDKSK